MVHELPEPATEVSFLSLDDLASRIGDRLEFLHTNASPSLEILDVDEYCRLMDLIAASQPFQRYRDGNYQEPTCFEPDDRRVRGALLILNHALVYQGIMSNSHYHDKCTPHKDFCMEFGSLLFEKPETNFKLSLPDVEEIFSWFKC